MLKLIKFLSGVLAVHVRAQNAAIFIRKRPDVITFETFEVLPLNSAVMSASRLVCTYPGPAVEVSYETAGKEHFWDQFAAFLAQMDFDPLDAVPAVIKAGRIVAEVRDTAHPFHVCELLMQILRGMGREARNVTRVTKTIVDDVVWKNTSRPWRRSPLWFVIRVALQTTMESITDYKRFMLSFLSSVLQRAVTEEFPSDLLHVMRAKISRRFAKLAKLDPTYDGQTVLKLVEHTHDFLQDRWSAIQTADATVPEFLPAQLDPANDTEIALTNSHDYLLKTLYPDPQTAAHAPFSPSENPRITSCDFAAYADQKLAAAIDAHGRLALVDFEAAVQDHIDNWTNENLNNEQACPTLASCFDQYKRGGESIYTQDALEKSTFILTLMELWMAVDILSCEQYPLLLDYSPEVPPKFLEPLLLRTSTARARSLTVEKYLARRRSQALSNPSLFSNAATIDHFSVKHFNEDDELQELKRSIELSASAARMVKRQELRKKTTEYNNLLQQASGMRHSYTMDEDGDKKHYHACPRCALETQANNITIDIHEWPLPSDDVDAATVVFELRCPLAIAVWRTITWRILSDIGIPDRKKAKASIAELWKDYNGLDGHGVYSEWNHITLASTAKSFTTSHYMSGGKHFPIAESEVLLNNGLKLGLFDKRQHTWATEPLRDAQVASYGTLELAETSPYKYLQYAVSGTSHTSNQVIADQANCPKDINLHEHYSFGTLRSGPALQWMNIFRELTANTLRFHRQEVVELIEMAVWQAGPANRQINCRNWHVGLLDDQLTFGLVKQSFRLLALNESSWLNIAAARALGSFHLGWS